MPDFNLKSESGRSTREKSLERGVLPYKNGFSSFLCQTKLEKKQSFDKSGYIYETSYRHTRFMYRERCFRPIYFYGMKTQIYLNRSSL